MRAMRRQFHMDEVKRTGVKTILRMELECDSRIAFAYLFGSFVADELAFHDIDLGVYFADPEPVQPSDALDLAERLSARLGLPVDVRALNNAPVSFVYQVLRGELLLSRDDLLLADLIEHSARVYLDAAPLLRHSTIEAFGR